MSAQLAPTPFFSIFASAFIDAQNPFAGCRSSSSVKCVPAGFWSPMWDANVQPAVNVVGKEIPMAKSTRRAILRDGSFAVGAATLISLTSSNLAEAESNSDSVFHVFAFQWKQGTSQAQKDRAAKEIAAFQGVIPGLLQTHVGPNISPRGKGFTFGGIMQFKDKASLDAYVEHPAHQTLLAWLVPLIDAIELDLRA